MRKIKFPLEMANGAQVRNMEELRESFDLEAALGYFVDGKLLTWLEDRYYEDEAEKVEALSKDDPALARKLCAALGVTCPHDSPVDAEEIAYRKERLARLRQYTEEEEILAQVDKVAFDQEDLADLYDMGVEPIYLCANHFRIPRSKQSLTYIPIAGATADGVTLTKPEAKPEEKPAPVVPAPSRIEIGISDGKIIKKEDGKKTVISTLKRDDRVHNIVNNEQYLFVDMSSDHKSRVRRIDLATGEKKDILNDGWFDSISIIGSNLVWTQQWDICMCDFDGDFRKELLSGNMDRHPTSVCYSKHMIFYLQWKLYGNSYSVERMDPETGEIVSIGSAYCICVGNEKLYVYSYEKSTLSEWDLDGNCLRIIKQDMPFTSVMSYNNGIVSCSSDTLLGEKRIPLRIKV